jgi:serine/threonine-protein kinase
MDSLVGTQIGHYRLERVLASGGMAAVLEAVHVAHGQRVAVKVLRRDLRRSIDPIARLVQEGRVICSLLHEHIVRVFDYGTADESIAFIVMELLQGRTLAGLLDQERRLAPNRAAFIRSRICARSSSCVGPLAASTAASSLISVVFARLTALTSRKTTQAMIRKFSSAVMKAP